MAIKRGSKMAIDPRWLATVMIVIQALVAIAYFLAPAARGGWRKVLYWTAAAALTYAVTW